MKPTTEIKDSELYKKFCKALNIGAEMRIEPNPFVLDCIKICEEHAAIVLASNIEEHVKTYEGQIRKLLKDNETLKSLVEHSFKAGRISDDTAFEEFQKTFVPQPFLPKINESRQQCCCIKAKNVGAYWCDGNCYWQIKTDRPNAF